MSTPNKSSHKNRLFKPKKKTLFNISYKWLPNGSNPLDKSTGYYMSCDNGNIVDTVTYEIREYLSHGETNIRTIDALKFAHPVYGDNQIIKLNSWPTNGHAEYPDLSSKFLKAQTFNLNYLSIYFEYQKRLYQDFNIYSVIEETPALDMFGYPVNAPLIFMLPDAKILHDEAKTLDTLGRLDPSYYGGLVPFLSNQVTTLEEFESQGKSIEHLNPDDFRITITSAIAHNIFYIPDFVKKFKFKGQNEIIKLTGGNNLLEIPYEPDYEDETHIKEYNIDDLKSHGIPEVDPSIF